MIAAEFYQTVADIIRYVNSTPVATATVNAKIIVADIIRYVNNTPYRRQARIQGHRHFNPQMATDIL